MRAIDADVLIGDLHNYAFLDGDDRSICYHVIQKQPTIEPERKTGKWIPVNEQPYFRKHFHKVCCSRCFAKGYEHWKFCPNCGAYMKGESNED